MARVRDSLIPWPPVGEATQSWYLRRLEPTPLLLSSPPCLPVVESPTSRPPSHPLDSIPSFRSEILRLSPPSFNGAFVTPSQSNVPHIYCHAATSLYVVSSPVRRSLQAGPRLPSLSLSPLPRILTHFSPGLLTYGRRITVAVVARKITNAQPPTDGHQALGEATSSVI